MTSSRQCGGKKTALTMCKMLNAAAQGCVSGPEPKRNPNGCLVIPRTKPFVPEADGLKMALSNCHGFRINCLPQSVPTEEAGTKKDVMASHTLTLCRQKPTVHRSERSF